MNICEVTRSVSTSIIACALLIIAATITAAPNASAQIAWNPPCSAVKVVNNSSCTFNGTISTTPAGIIPTPIASGSSNSYPVPLGGTIDNVITPYLNTYPFVPLGFGVWWVNAITMGPPDCCVDVTADLNTCTITISDPVLPYICHD